MPDYSSLDPQTPVIVGVAQIIQRPDDVAEAVEAVQLMIDVTRAAAADTGVDLLPTLDAIGVISGAWSYSDPARLIGRDIGATEAHTMLSAMGGNTPQSFVNAVASRIQAGLLSSAVIVGAETIWSRRRQRAAGLPVPSVTQKDEEPDERFGADVQMQTPFEESRGLKMPINYYPIFESAIRHQRGETLDAHRGRIAAMWERFNVVARSNPYAWSPTPMTATEIVEVSPTNRMVGFPYTKAMNSNWDLDQGAALILCSLGRALELGIDPARFVFPLAGTDAHDTYAVSERRDLHSSPAIHAAGERLFALGGVGPDDVDHLDLYSCFPSAVQVGAQELGFDEDRQLTVTGGLPFAGGPLNNYVTHSIAAMVERLRNDPGSLGMVTANGGFLTKHAMALYSTTPPAEGFVWADVQDVVDAVAATSVDEAYTGPGTIEAYTVMHDKAGPDIALAAVRTPGGARTWAQSSDDSTMNEMLQIEAIGRVTIVAEDGTFTLA